MTETRRAATTMNRKSVLDYRQIVFDCDGVLFDSNEIKAANIESAASNHCDADTLRRFVDYFVAHNGVPRQTKVARFFSQPAVRDTVLDRYAELNAATFGLLDVIPAARAFLARLQPLGIPLYALTGGDQRETAALLDRARIASNFARILGGPTSKTEHLGELRLEGRTLFFGDSAHDYRVAESFGFDFVFLTRYTQMRDWAAFFAERPHVHIAYDFESLTDWIPCSE